MVSLCQHPSSPPVLRENVGAGLLELCNALGCSEISVAVVRSCSRIRSELTLLWSSQPCCYQRPRPSYGLTRDKTFCTSSSGISASCLGCDYFNFQVLPYIRWYICCCFSVSYTIRLLHSLCLCFSLLLFSLLHVSFFTSSCSCSLSLFTSLKSVKSVKSSPVKSSPLENTEKCPAVKQDIRI